MLNSIHPGFYKKGFFFRWDAKKRLTPEDALRHEWLKSSTLSVSHTSQEVRRSPSESGTPSQLRGSLSSVGDSQHSGYRVHRARKWKYSDGDLTESNDVRGATTVKVNVTPSTRHTSSSDADTSLDDSGTFLPPIL